MAPLVECTQCSGDLENTDIGKGFFEGNDIEHIELDLVLKNISGDCKNEIEN